MLYNQKECEKYYLKIHSFFSRGIVSGNFAFSTIIRLDIVLIILVQIEDINMHLKKKIRKIEKKIFVR
jgi:hypothetical protein